MQSEQLFVAGSLIRIAFGVIVLSLYLMHFTDREFLFGPSGLLPFATFRELVTRSHQINVFAWNSSEVYFNSMYLVGALVSLAFMLGWKTRFITPLFVLFTWSIYHRMPYMMDGGYRLMTILLMYLLFADMGRYFSFDATRHSRNGQEWKTCAISTMFHNGAIAMCMMQICFVYFFSTFYKITGETWQHGTALYGALSLQQFNTGFFAEIIRLNPIVITLMTYGTLIYQSAFPWLIWHPRLKYVVLVGAITLHAGIALTMGLFWFSAIMIACEVVFIRDAEYLRIFSAIRSWNAARQDRASSKKHYATA